MGTDSVPEKSQNLHTLTRLSAREGFIQIAFHLHIIQVCLIVANFALTIFMYVPRNGND